MNNNSHFLFDDHQTKTEKIWDTVMNNNCTQFSFIQHQHTDLKYSFSNPTFSSQTSATSMVKKKKHKKS